MRTSRVLLILFVLAWAGVAAAASGDALSGPTLVLAGGEGVQVAKTYTPEQGDVRPAQGGAIASWSFDPAHCSIVFFVKHILAKVPGSFDVYSGTVRFDPANPEAGSIDVSVDLKSVNTGIQKRDEHLRSPDFFDVAKYPAMWFVSQKIVKKGENKYVAEGDLTIKDVTKRIELSFTFLGTKPSPMEKGKQVAGFEATFSINMLDYHVGDGKFQQMGVLGETVDIILNMEMLR
ncbi:MAG: YceI family protein [Desulfovibrio sp.]|nr:YceI family protein [Desulfovibrio sp.]MBI4961078.1 YceI family protein [Desulfovibrio sp.]